MPGHVSNVDKFDRVAGEHVGDDQVIFARAMDERIEAAREVRGLDGNERAAVQPRQFDPRGIAA